MVYYAVNILSTGEELQSIPDNLCKLSVALTYCIKWPRRNNAKEPSQKVLAGSEGLITFFQTFFPLPSPP